MPSFTGTSIQQPTSSQPKNSGGFFNFPPEIRNMVYDNVAASFDIFVPKKSHREWAVDCPKVYVKNSFKGSDSSKALKPSSMALAHTCRQAYGESSNRHYRNKTYLIHSGYLLQKFISEVSPAHVRTIEGLRVNSLSRMKPLKTAPKRPVGPTSAPRSAVATSDTPDTPYSLVHPEHIAPQHLAPLKAFHGLKRLIIREKWDTSKVLLPGDPSPFGKTIRVLATLGNDLPRLERIELKSEVPYPLMQGWGTFPRDTDEVPGWHWVVQNESLDRKTGVYHITEILTRECPAQSA